MHRLPGGKIYITSGGMTFASSVAPVSMSASVKNALAALGTKEEDLLYLSYPLVHEGANRNGDVFLRDEMSQAFKTLEGTQVDKDHLQNIDAIVGKNYYSDFSMSEGKAVINVSAYVYQNLYPDVAYKIKDGTINAVSMETHFGWAERLTNERILHDLNFCGAGLVRTPADPQALLQYHNNMPKSPGTSGTWLGQDRRRLLTLSALVAAMEVSNVEEY